MRSLEKSHRSTDIDQVDPEHINRVAAESSWDDLSKVPFSGNQQQTQENNKDAIENLKGLIDRLTTDDETIQSKREEEARQRAQDLFQEMDRIGSFGKNARSGNKFSTKEANEAKEAGKDDITHHDLSDISASF